MEVELAIEKQQHRQSKSLLTDTESNELIGTFFMGRKSYIEPFDSIAKELYQLISKNQIEEFYSRIKTLKHPRSFQSISNFFKLIKKNPVPRITDRLTRPLLNQVMSCFLQTDSLVNNVECIELVDLFIELYPIVGDKANIPLVIKHLETLISKLPPEHVKIIAIASLKCVKAKLIKEGHYRGFQELKNIVERLTKSSHVPDVLFGSYLNLVFGLELSPKEIRESVDKVIDFIDNYDGYCLNVFSAYTHIAEVLCSHEYRFPGTDFFGKIAKRMIKRVSYEGSVSYDGPGSYSQMYFLDDLILNRLMDVSYDAMNSFLKASNERITYFHPGFEEKFIDLWGEEKFREFLLGDHSDQTMMVISLYIYYDKRGRHEEAIEYIKEFLELKPDQKTKDIYKGFLCTSLINSSRFKEAFPLIEQLDKSEQCLQYAKLHMHLQKEGYAKESERFKKIAFHVRSQISDTNSLVAYSSTREYCTSRLISFYLEHDEIELAKTLALKMFSDFEKEQEQSRICAKLVELDRFGEASSLVAGNFSEKYIDTLIREKKVKNGNYMEVLQVLSDSKECARIKLLGLMQDASIHKEKDLVEDAIRYLQEALEYYSSIDIYPRTKAEILYQIGKELLLLERTDIMTQFLSKYLMHPDEKELFIYFWLKELALKEDLYPEFFQILQMSYAVPNTWTTAIEACFVFFFSIKEYTRCIRLLESKTIFKEWKFLIEPLKVLESISDKPSLPNE